MLTPRSDRPDRDGPSSTRAKRRSDRCRSFRYRRNNALEYAAPESRRRAKCNTVRLTSVILDTSNSPFPGSLRFVGQFSPLALTLRPNESPDPCALSGAIPWSRTKASAGHREQINTTHQNPRSQRQAGSTRPDTRHEPATLLDLGSGIWEVGARMLKHTCTPGGCLYKSLFITYTE